MDECEDYYILGECEFGFFKYTGVTKEKGKMAFADPNLEQIEVNQSKINQVIIGWPEKHLLWNYYFVMNNTY